MLIRRAPDRYAETIRRHELTGRRVLAPITFTTDPRAPKMELTIQEYSGPEKGASRDGPNCAIPREYIPSWGTLASWAGQQILREAGEPFQKAIESFIIVYSDRPNNRDLKLPKVCPASAWCLSLFRPIGSLRPGPPNARRLLRGRHVPPPLTPPHTPGRASYTPLGLVSRTL